MTFPLVIVQMESYDGISMLNQLVKWKNNKTVHALIQFAINCSNQPIFFVKCNQGIWAVLYSVSQCNNMNDVYECFKTKKKHVDNSRKFYKAVLVGNEKWSLRIFCRLLHQDFENFLTTSPSRFCAHSLGGSSFIQIFMKISACMWFMLTYTYI